MDFLSDFLASFYHDPKFWKMFLLSWSLYLYNFSMILTSKFKQDDKSVNKGITSLNTTILKYIIFQVFYKKKAKKKIQYLIRKFQVM